MTDVRIWAAACVIALVTAALRFLPFAVFRGNRKTPRVIEKLSKTLPYAIMGMLVVYCLRNVKLASLSEVLPALIGRLVVGVLHIWKRNTLLSILAGTVCYMVLLQVVF